MEDTSNRLAIAKHDRRKGNLISTPDINDQEKDLLRLFIGEAEKKPSLAGTLPRPVPIFQWAKAP
jgi:hypothetical protein